MSEEQKPKSLDIERRVEISLAVQRYLRAAEQFEAASLAFKRQPSAPFSHQRLGWKLPG